MGKKERIERVISERVVGEKIIGSANPIARGFRNVKKEIVGAFQGIFIGFILFFIAIWVSCADVERHSKEVNKIEPVAAEQAQGLSGLQVVTGSTDLLDKIKAPNVDGYVLHYNWEKQEWNTWIETETYTETVIKDGKEVEITKERDVEKQGWKTLEEKSKYANFKMGPITVNPEGSRIDLKTESITKNTGINAAGNDTQQITNYTKLPSNLTVLGEISGDVISGGEVFRITTLSPDKLVEQMEKEEKQAYMTYKVIAVVLFTFAFNLMLGPILLLTRLIPILGGLARTVVFIISLIISIVLVALITFVVKFWWLLLLIMFLAAGVAISIGLSKKDKEPDTAKA